MITQTHSKLFAVTAALLLLTLASACGPATEETLPDGGRAVIPSVSSTSPNNGATDVAVNGSITATFTEPMDPATLTPSTFTVTSGSEKVSGTVVYADKTVVFWPSAYLPSNASITATITNGAKSAPGAKLDAQKSWSFKTGDKVAPGQPVNLGTAGGFVILAKSAVTVVPAATVTGDIGVSPAAASYITGLSLTADSTNVFATSPQVTGKVYAADYAVPSPSNMTTAVSDMELAFTDAAGRAPDKTELGAGNIGGMTLAPGVYKWGTGLLIPTNVTLSGGSTGVWIFQIAQNLTVESATRITLTGGAQAKNIFWQVAGSVDLGTTSHLEGSILSQTSITLRTGASINGRLLAQTAVSIDGSTVTAPAP